VLVAAEPIESMIGLHVLQVEGLRELLAKSGFSLEVRVSREVYSRRPTRALDRLTTHKSAAAWILLNSSAAMQHWFMQHQVPCVIIGTAHPGITSPSLGTDYQALGHHAAGMFLRRGHRQLALVLPDDAMAGHTNTEIGFKAAAALVEGVSIQSIRHNGQPDTLFRSITHLLKYSPATGFLVAVPHFVLTVMSAFSAAGAQLPRDISLISRDSDAYLDYIRPSVARYVINVPQYVKKICQATLLVSRGGVPRVRAQLLQRDYVGGDTLGDVSAP
jgi:LacI family transcriptional regulator